ncbi:MAG: SDR family oxidoreductase [Thermomicrobiales bacterium]|nr:SDR family oxidoreductase [Thermomicrobiales bacterium]MCO5219997.1 SDR family oxidoreductase [Thermomicrobiales bacterium]
MELRVDGKVALVTGADSGIGRGIALRLAEAGADVTVCYYSDRAGAEQTAAECQAVGRNALIAQGDIGDPATVERIFSTVDETFGRIDILVNNAGLAIDAPIVDQDFGLFERVIRTNLFGPFLTIQQAARRMIAQGDGGRIVNITSVHEEACFAGASAYNTSKGGLRNLSRTAAAELGRYGITVNVIAPGMILTPMNHRAISDQEYLDNAEKQIVLGRAGQPDDIARMALFLASDAASYCTGQTHYVDGGWMLTWPPV